MSYVKTTPGTFKCISIVLGLLALALTATSYDRASYHHAISIDEDDKEYSAQKSCELGNKGVKDDDKKTCPWGWLVALSLILIGITLVATVAMFAVCHVVDPYQVGLEKIDFLLHLVTGCLFILAAILNVVFIVMIYLTDDNPSKCKENRLKGYKASDNEKEQEEKLCHRIFRAKYRPLLLIGGVIFSIAAGVLYIVAAMMLRRQRPMMGGGVAPMMMVTPSGQQQPPPMTFSLTEAPPQSQAPPPENHPHFLEEPEEELEQPHPSGEIGHKGHHKHEKHHKHHSKKSAKH